MGCNSYPCVVMFTAVLSITGAFYNTRIVMSCYFHSIDLSQFQYYINYIICSTALTWSVPVIELQLVMGIDFKPEIQQCVQCKDAGFVYKSLRNETNPRYESLRFGFANPDSRIRSLRIRKDSDSRISIFKDSFRAIVLWICKDLLNLWKQVESFENWLDSWSRYEPNLFKLGFVIHDTNQIFLSPDSWPTNRYEYMDSRNESMFLRISYTNPASLVQCHFKVHILLLKKSFLLVFKKFQKRRNDRPFVVKIKLSAKYVKKFCFTK